MVFLIAKIVLMQHLAIIMSFWMMSIILTGLHGAGDLQPDPSQGGK